MKLTKELIKSACRRHATWNYDQYKLAGVECPPQKGWMKSMIGIEVSDSTWSEILRLKRVSKRVRRARRLANGWSGISTRKTLYLEYLKSDHWMGLRKEAFTRDGFKCLRCGSKSMLRGHHKRYRKDLRLCTVRDIETLCDACHKLHHKEKKRIRKMNRKTRSSVSRLTWLICAFSAGHQ